MQEPPPCKESNFLDVEDNNSPDKENFLHPIDQAPINTSNIRGLNNGSTV